MGRQRIGAPPCPYGVLPLRPSSLASPPPGPCANPQKCWPLGPQQSLRPCGHHSAGPSIPSWDGAAQATLPEPPPGPAPSCCWQPFLKPCREQQLCSEKRDRTASLPLQHVCKELWDETEGNGPRSDCSKRLGQDFLTSGGEMGEVSPGVMPRTDIPLPMTHAWVPARDGAGDWATWRPITWLEGAASGSFTEGGHVKRTGLPHEASPNHVCRPHNSPPWPFSRPRHWLGGRGGGIPKLYLQPGGGHRLRGGAGLSGTFPACCALLNSAQMLTGCQASR